VNQKPQDLAIPSKKEKKKEDEEEALRWARHFEKIYHSCVQGTNSAQGGNTAQTQHLEC
jgi:hypothetical protein